MAADKKRNSTTRRAARSLARKIPSIRSLSRKNCPPGMIPRKAYLRRYSTAVRARGFTVKKKSGKEYRVLPKNADMLVESRCIKDVALPKKGSKLFGPLKKGELAKHGYTFRASEAERHAALKKAISEYGSTGVFRKLNAVAKLTKHASPNASNIFSKDREWVHKSI